MNNLFYINTKINKIIENLYNEIDIDLIKELIKILYENNIINDYDYNNLYYNTINIALEFNQGNLNYNYLCNFCYNIKLNHFRLEEILHNKNPRFAYIRINDFAINENIIYKLNHYLRKRKIKNIKS